MKTNFDKWKEGLTAEGYIAPLFRNCRRCPLESCDPKKTCFDNLLDWFNAPAEESEPAPLTSTITWHKYPEERPRANRAVGVCRRYLVHTSEGDTCTEYWDSDEDCGWENADCWDVTHWAELPLPPKEAK